MAEIQERDAPGQPIEIWFQDEARIGQKNKITRRWAKRGTRPVALQGLQAQTREVAGYRCSSI